ncbi:protein containing EDD domain protein, DegV family [Lentimicrobium saccharophilum]|uniref:Protein containing EDD domain protein, DegV family n=1 Tax=Lentimicrobium saccharophilum TaxID=1678841 RepID=A0A0S7C5Z2_9BACT|nr:DegV family protein [Lentimicrobium saccharophilum]GAP44515.1 protein containing EDD domain protein, DegV family [Lentimicrobium saccharophilum]
MNKNTKSLTELDGKTLYYSFLAGAQKIFENQVLINKINVFPVADADTGTNLASTMRSIVDSPIPTADLKMTAAALADAALTGARGNSGIIFAQFVYGFSNEIQKHETVSVETFAEVVKKAVTYAYEAIANPIEGTMITVIREWAEFIYILKDSIKDFIELLAQAYLKALESLQATTGQLAVLKKSNVVDAGAKGFVVFLQGMVEFVNAGELRKLLSGRETVVIADSEVVSHDVITYRYCTEAMLVTDEKKKPDLQMIRKGIAHMGDSMVVAGSARKMRVHIHTDHPAKVMKVLSKYGSISFQKVDDMVMQQEIATNPKFPVAIVTDSTCDIPQELIERYQLQVVPLSVHFGENYFLDRLTILPAQFYSMIDKAPAYPSTAQPAYKDFFNRYSYLASHYDSIIGIHISASMSGTWSNSSKASHAVAEHSGKKISVLNSKRLSSGLGLIVLRAAKALENGATHDEIVSKMDTWSNNTKILVSSKTIKYMVKSGRVSYTKGLIGSLLNLKPIVTINNEGRSEAFGKPFTEKGSMELVIAKIRSMASERKIWGYSISHARNLSTANWYADRMREICGLEPEFINDASPVLGVNVGPGVVALSVMFED